MRTIKRSSTFKRDYKRESKGQYRSGLDDALVFILTILVNDEKLIPRFCDHDLLVNGLAIVNAI